MSEKRDMAAVMADLDHAHMRLREDAYAIADEVRLLKMVGLKDLAARLQSVQCEMEDMLQLAHKASCEITGIYIGTVDQGTSNMLAAALGIGAVAAGNKELAEASAKMVKTETVCAS